MAGLNAFSSVAGNELTCVCVNIAEQSFELEYCHVHNGVVAGHRALRC